MKKQIILLCSQFALAAIAIAQTEGLPPQPVPGKCYTWSVSPPVFETTEKRIQVRPAYNTLEKIPAVYKTVDERVLIKQASKQFVPHPAVYKTVIDTIVVEDPYEEVAIVPEMLGTKPGSIEVRPKITTAEWKSLDENCQSNDPRDCMVLQYVEQPAEYQSVNYQFLQKDATYRKTSRPGKTMTIARQVLVKEAYFETIEIPAEYQTITKRVLVREEEVVEKEVPAAYAIVAVQSLKDPGGTIKWEEIECGLTEHNELSISFEQGSARLTNEARNAIDNKLLKLMKDKPNLRVEVSSHTDSKGTAQDNLRMSQARAEAVVNYLVSRGIQRSRLTAVGYGESILKNRCADGVKCTEAEHAQNRRTAFRVLN